jgi:hypothetical protein
MLKNTSQILRVLANVLDKDNISLNKAWSKQRRNKRKKGQREIFPFRFRKQTETRTVLFGSSDFSHGEQTQDD